MTSAQNLTEPPAVSTDTVDLATAVITTLLPAAEGLSYVSPSAYRACPNDLLHAWALDTGDPTPADAPMRALALRPFAGGIEAHTDAAVARYDRAASARSLYPAPDGLYGFVRRTPSACSPTNPTVAPTAPPAPTPRPPRAIPPWASTGDRA